ncbi:RND family efflux transporter, MFP subunit [Spongiibacter sp. IMCC21906]|uniref:efflux RND transporter periplasmic adaptor subunit n=1 Tax=Spongiibacter sp. IMCC21906 TaxID=1620392 RepID=UPI00062DDACE|nr:efflux RND transporter periplasmic adaptor subunit [Spongiibacter sp. IMCC21906]AKH70075.1 RND family efflux transporter, MFP subunit [Spongiibacter sp. IMCC21906]
MSKRMIILLSLAVLAFGGVVGMKWFSNKMMNDFLNDMPTPPVTTTSATVERSQWDNTLTAVGSLVAVNGADLASEVDGVVKAIHFESGQHVEKGSLLIELDSAVEQGELNRLEAQGDLAELDSKRIEKLFKRGSISKSEYDKAMAETKVAVASAAAQRGRVAQKQIRAPFSGQLGIRRVNVGQYLSPGQFVVTLQALHPIDVDFTLPESELGQVEEGLTIAMKLDGYADETFAGELIAIDPKVNPNTRNFDLRGRIPNEDMRLKPGQFAQLTLNLPGSADVLVLPRTAINYASYGATVFVIEKNPEAGPPPEEPDPSAPPYTDLLVKQRFVSLGKARGDYVEITSGLEEGTKVASSGLLKLRSGQPVIIDNAMRPNTSLEPSPPES